MYYQMGSRAALMKLGMHPQLRGALGDAVDAGLDVLHHAPDGGEKALRSLSNGFANLGTVGGVLPGAAVGAMAADDEHVGRGALLGAVGGAALGRGAGRLVGEAGAHGLSQLAPRAERDALRNQLSHLRAPPVQTAPHTMPTSLIPPAPATPSLFPGLSQG